jgi:CBS domain-containing protein
MAAKPGQSSNKTIKCPSCGSENILGVDRCETCFHSLMQRGLPKPKKDDNFQSVMMTAPIAELMTGRDLLVGSTTDTVQKVVKILQKEKKSCVLIYEKKKLVGIISLRDLLKKVVGKHKDLSKVKVGAAMTPNPEFVRSEDPIAYAVNKVSFPFKTSWNISPAMTIDSQPYKTDLDDPTSLLG